MCGKLLPKLQAQRAPRYGLGHGAFQFGISLREVDPDMSAAVCGRLTVKFIECAPLFFAKVNLVFEFCALKFLYQSQFTFAALACSAVIAARSCRNARAFSSSRS